MTITATSANDSSKTLQGNISITSTIVVSFAAAPPSSMLIDGATNLAATLTNDTQNQGVTWSCAPAALCGNFTPTATLSGVSTSFASPSAVPAGNNVTVTATSVSDYTKSAHASIAITSNIVVNFTTGFNAPSSMNTNTQVQVAATTGSTDPANAGVTWTANCGSAGACGTFNPATTANNVPTLYTAPLAVPTGTTVTITASAVSDFNKTATSNAVTITQTNATLPDGTYIFQLNGEDSNGQSGDSPFNVTGAFTMQSGEIVGGEQDFADSTFTGQDAIIRGGSTTIVTTADGNLQIVFDTGDTNIGTGASGLETMNVALTSPTSGLVTWFDGFASGSGTIVAQNSTAALSLPQSGYAFLTSGYDSTLQSVVIGGILNVDDLNSTTGTISGNGSVFDINNWGNIQQGQTFQQSTVLGPNSAPGAPDSYGRITFTLNPSTASKVSQLQLAGYIIDSNTIALGETADKFGGVTGGTALAQGSANTGKISQTNLSGYTYAVGDAGTDIAFFLDFAGTLTFAANGSVTGTADFQDTYSRLTGSISAPASSYQVEANGRVTISNLLLNSGKGEYGPMTLQLYIDGHGNALTATMDTTDVLAGPAYLQTFGGTFTGNYALGGAGYSAASSSPSGWSAAGVINISSGTVQTGSFTDFTSFENSQSSDLGLRGTVTGTSGTIVGFGALTPSGSDTFDFYPIDDFHAFGIETDAIQTGLLYFAGTNSCTPAKGALNSCADSKAVKTRK